MTSPWFDHDKNSEARTDAAGSNLQPSWDASTRESFRNLLTCWTGAGVILLWLWFKDRPWCDAACPHRSRRLWQLLDEISCRLAKARVRQLTFHYNILQAVLCSASLLDWTLAKAGHTEQRLPPNPSLSRCSTIPYMAETAACCAAQARALPNQSPRTWLGLWALAWCCKMPPRQSGSGAQDKVWLIEQR